MGPPVGQLAPAQSGDRHSARARSCARPCHSPIEWRRAGTQPHWRRKLEAANVSLRPGEWAVVHGLIAVLAALLTTLLTNFNLLLALIAFGLGLVLPWLYLGYLREQATQGVLRRSAGLHADAGREPDGRVLACPRRWTTSPRSRAAPSDRRSTGHCLRADSVCPWRSPWRLWPSGCRARTSTGWSWRSGSTGGSAATSRRSSPPWARRSASASVCAGRSRP